MTLEVISVNIWQILISLINLLLIFLILKKVLFKRVKKMLADRQAALDKQYADADEAKRNALENQVAWEEKIQSAHSEADRIMKEANVNAMQRSDAILAETKERADAMMRQAEAEAKLERKKATAAMQHEIVEVSTQLSEKMLGREIRTEDHRALIDSFIDEIGEDNDANG